MICGLNQEISVWKLFFWKVQVIGYIFHIYHMCSKWILMELRAFEATCKIIVFYQNHLWKYCVRVYGKDNNENERFVLLFKVKSNPPLLRSVFWTTQREWTSWTLKAELASSGKPLTHYQRHSQHQTFLRAPGFLKSRFSFLDFSEHTHLLSLSPNLNFLS